MYTILKFKTLESNMSDLDKLSEVILARAAQPWSDLTSGPSGAPKFSMEHSPASALHERAEEGRGRGVHRDHGRAQRGREVRRREVVQEHARPVAHGHSRNEDGVAEVGRASCRERV